MLVRRLVALVSLTACTAFAAPVPKGLKASNTMDTARFKLNYKDAAFEKVLEDFAEGTGLEWIGERPDLGTLTLKPNKEYSGVEFLDLLNAVLEYKSEPRQYILVRHARTFYLHPADQPVDPEKVDTVTDEDVIPRRLPVAPPATDQRDGGRWEEGRWVPAVPAAKWEKLKRGKTETATLALELNGLTFADIGPQIKKSLSPTGRMELGERGDTIRVTDRVDNLRTVVAVLTENPK